MEEKMVRTLFKISAGLVILFYLPAAVHSQLWKKVTKKEKPTFFEMQHAANKFYENIKDGRKPGYKQFKRWEWFARTRLDKNGYFNTADNWNGWLEKQERFGPTSDADGSDWRPLGPFGKPQRVSSNGGVGRLNCIAFDPRDTDIIWVGAPTGGLWKSMDGGQSWSTGTDHLPNLGVSDIAINPQNPDVMYIATGDKQRGSALSIGVMKSPDGGRTWQLTGLNPDVTEKCKIGKLLMHPDNPETLLAATSQGVYKTEDGGGTWVNTLTGDFFDMEVNPANSSTWYVSQAGVGIFRSVDSGENWARLGNGLPEPGPGFGRIAIAVSQSSPSIIYALYCQDAANQGWIWGLYGVYRSMDGGNTWNLRINSPNLLGWELDGSDSGGQGGYALVLHVNPEDPNVVFVASVNMWKSTDGGATWNVIATNVHVDHHDFAYLPGSSSTVFLCNDGGLHKSENDGASWTDISDGLAMQQIYRVSLSAQDPNMVAAGAQDNGSEILNGPVSGWGSVYGGDGADCLIDPSDSSIVYCAWQRGNFVRSNNGGSSFVGIFNGKPRGAWLAPIAFAPDDPATVYTASFAVYKSINRGTAHTDISGPLTGSPVTSLVVAPSDPGCIYVSDGNDMFRTVNGGDNWTQLNTAVFPTYITGIAVHPHNRDTLWATVGGYGRWNSRFLWFHLPYETDKEKVFYSTDGGATWLNVSGPLPNIPANCIEIDPFSLDVYVGTDLGVFYSTDGLGDWKSFDNGLPNVIVTDLEIHSASGKIAAATYGRGLWVSPLAAVSSTPRIYPPRHFTGETVQNRSLLQTEYINVLRWEANPLNDSNNMNISGYRLYRVSGTTRTLLADLDAGTFEYEHRGLEQASYGYALTAVGANGIDSESLYLTVRVM